MEVHQTEETAWAASVGRIATMDGREPQEICWVVFRGRNGFTGICGTVKEHNLRVIGASGVRNQRFRCRIWALVWLAEQAEEERLQAGLRAEEEAYAAANAVELDNEERARYERREVRRRMAAEWDTQVEGGRWTWRRTGGRSDGRRRKRPACQNQGGRTRSGTRRARS